MTIAASVTVSSTPIRLVGAGSIVAAALSVRIKNTHATEKLIIGGPGVTAANGFAIDGGQTFDFGNLDASDSVWAVRGGSVDVVAHVLTK
jgi:hypothetical protein